MYIYVYTVYTYVCLYIYIYVFWRKSRKQMMCTLNYILPGTLAQRWACSQAISFRAK